MTTPAADKRFGQHYLRDHSVVQKMIAAMKLSADTPVLEIGPGPGVLTKALLATGAPVTVVEIDERMLPGLEELAAEYPNQLTIHHADALEVDFTTLVPAGSRFCGNLPYNVGTEIVLRALWQGTHWHSLTVMLQKEVIDRFLANAGDRDWGKLGVWADLLSTRYNLVTVKPGAFVPPPKVMSAVAQLIPREQPAYPYQHKALERTLHATFGQRRKMLRASLKGKITTDQLEQLGIEPTARPETLATEQFCKLSEQL